MKRTVEEYLLACDAARAKRLVQQDRRRTLKRERMRELMKDPVYRARKAELQRWRTAKDQTQWLAYLKSPQRLVSLGTNRPRWGKGV